VGVVSSQDYDLPRNFECVGFYFYTEAPCSRTEGDKEIVFDNLVLMLAGDAFQVTFVTTCNLLCHICSSETLRRHSKEELGSTESVIGKAAILVFPA